MGLVVSLASEPPGVYHRTPPRALLYRDKPWKALGSMLILTCHLIFSHGMFMRMVFVLSSQHLLGAIGWLLSISPIHLPWTCSIGEGG
jgi:hypothetical protein